jgi:hypothetical protein
MLSENIFSNVGLDKVPLYGFFDKKIIQKINSIFVMYNFQKMKLK